LGDQRYVKHCRDNNLPVPRGGEIAEDACNDTPGGTGHALYVQNDGRTEALKEEKLEETLIATMDEATVEREFWHTMSSSSSFSVQYANDVEGTYSRDFDAWDLSKMPTSSRCLLRLLPELIPGVTTPMLYIGMLFAHFCWHYEDNALYSINAMHTGAPKTWYCVPASAAGDLEKAADDIFANHPDRHHPLMHGAYMLMRKTVMMSPSILLARGVPVYRATQRPREIIVTFPRGYHSGFNHGFHTGEAINFAMPDWIPYGLASLQRYRAVGWLSVLDMERLIFDMAHRLARCKVRSPISCDAGVDHNRCIKALEEGEGSTQESASRRPAVQNPNFICLDRNTRSKDTIVGRALAAENIPGATEQEEKEEEENGWEDLMDREALTAVLWAVGGLIGWQQEVHDSALQSAAIARVKVLDEEERKGTGNMLIDRQLCCACNHILHTAWIEHDDNEDKTLTNASDYCLRRALAPRVCPDHMEFLGQSKPLRLILRYPAEYLQNLQHQLDILSPLALALPLAESAKATEVAQKWPLKGMTGETLGLAIRSSKQAQKSAIACTPPTPALCAFCRALRLSVVSLDSRSSFACSVLPSTHATSEDDTDSFKDKGDRKENASASNHPPACASNHPPARHVGCTCQSWNECLASADGRTKKNICRTMMPVAPLYRRKTFPTLQELLSGSLETVLSASVTPSAFRKHLLRLKPELKALVPALAQADADADAADMDSDHDTATVPSRSPAVSAHEEEVITEGEEKESDDVRARKRQKKTNQGKSALVGQDDSESDDVPLAVWKRKKPNTHNNSDEDDVPLAHRKQQPNQEQAAAVELEDSEDEDQPLAYKLQAKMAIRKVDATVDNFFQCDTPPDKQHQHKEDTADTNAKGGKGAKTSKGQHNFEVASEKAPSSSASNYKLSKKAVPQMDAEPTYGRKRWKVVNFMEKKRVDGSWAMTLRLVRKRKHAVPSSSR